MTVEEARALIGQQVQSKSDGVVTLKSLSGNTALCIKSDTTPRKIPVADLSEL